MDIKLKNNNRNNGAGNNNVSANNDASSNSGASRNNGAGNSSNNSRKLAEQDRMNRRKYAESIFKNGASSGKRGDE